MQDAINIRVEEEDNNRIKNFINENIDTFRKHLNPICLDVLLKIAQETDKKGSCDRKLLERSFYSELLEHYIIQIRRTLVELFQKNRKSTDPYLSLSRYTEPKPPNLTSYKLFLSTSKEGEYLDSPLDVDMEGSSYHIRNGYRIVTHTKKERLASDNDISPILSRRQNVRSLLNVEHESLLDEARGLLSMNELELRILASLLYAHQSGFIISDFHIYQEIMEIKDGNIAKTILRPLREKINEETRLRISGMDYLGITGASKLRGICIAVVKESSSERKDKLLKLELHARSTDTEEEREFAELLINRNLKRCS